MDNITNKLLESLAQSLDINDYVAGYYINVRDRFFNINKLEYSQRERDIIDSLLNELSIRDLIVIIWNKIF